MKAAALRLWARITQWVLGLGGLAAFIALVVSSTGGAVLARQFGNWSYLGFFGADTALTTIILLVLLPAKHKRAYASERLRSYFAKKTEEMQRSKWERFRRWPFVFVLVWTFATPILGALAARLAGVREEKAWTYSMTSNAIVNGLKVTAFLHWDVILPYVQPALDLAKKALHLA